MDPPPLSTTTTTTATPSSSVAAVSSINLSYPESSLNSDTWVPPQPRHEDTTDPLPPVPGGGKLRLMCSYGGHIVPRPHDKSLCYVGGDTRIVVLDRAASFSDVLHRLSATLLHGRPFSVKYQLPNHDLDSLISLSSDDDLLNMIDEYDRTQTQPFSRLRLFLFSLKPQSLSSMASLKSETWFVDALNGLNGCLDRPPLHSRGISDSAVTDYCDVSLGDFNKQLPGKSDCGYSALDSANSSFGSSSSSPSMSNLPPIRVRVAAEEQKAADPASIEEQFAQMSFASPPPPVYGDNVGGLGSKALSDDERSDHGGGSAAPVVFRKPPLPLQHKGNSGAHGLPSPDSVASDTSISSTNSLSKPMFYQDQQQQQAPPRGPNSPNTTNSIAVSDPASSPGTHLQQPKDPSGYLVPSHMDQYQYVPTSAQYMHQHHAATPMSPYYQIYPQTPQHQQYPSPLYVMSVAPPQTPQPYNVVDVVPTTRPTTPSSAGIPPVYPAKAPSPFPQHYVGYSHVSHHPSQSQNYAFEYTNPAPGAAPPHEQVYYAPHHVPTVAAPMPSSLYQSMTPVSAIALSEAAKQLPSDNNNTQQQIRTSQPP